MGTRTRCCIHHSSLMYLPTQKRASAQKRELRRCKDNDYFNNLYIFSPKKHQIVHIIYNILAPLHKNITFAPPNVCHLTSLSV